jgi:hypothetical protein
MTEFQGSHVLETRFMELTEQVEMLKHIPKQDTLYAFKT